MTDTPNIPPSREDLEAKVKDAEKELETMIANGEDFSTPADDEEEAVVEAAPEETEEEVEEPTEQEPELEAGPPEEDTHLEDPEEQEDEEDAELKKKLSASARENQRIYAKNRKLDQAIDEANELPEPTDEELAQVYEDWDLMTSTEKIFAKETLINKRFRERLSKGREEARKIEKWAEQVNEFVDDPQTFIDAPQLEGKQDAFKEFANQETNNAVPFKILVSAFLHEQSQIVKPKNKGKMFEVGNGGPNTPPKPKSDKIGIEESHKLMKTNYNKYVELLKAGKIDNTLT